MATIAEEINDLKSRVNSAYDACELKGATIPQDKTTWNLSSTIESIPTGAEMQTFYGVPISAFFPVRLSTGYWINPSKKTQYSLHISADTDGRLNFRNDAGTYLIFKRLLGNPGSSTDVYVTTPISSVIWEPTQMYVKSSFEDDYRYYSDIIDNMFFGMHYKYVSFPTLSNGINASTPGIITVKKDLNNTFSYAKIDKLDLPLYRGEKYFKFTGSDIGELYAPKLSSFDEGFMKDNVNLSSCTICRNVRLASVNSSFENCKSLSSFPLDSIETTTSSLMFQSNFMAKGMTSLSDVNLSVSLRVKNQKYSMKGAFQDCTSLSSAVIQFENIEEPILCCSSGTQSLSGMFNGCSSLERVDIRGITHFGAVTGSNINIGMKDAMRETASDSQLWMQDVEVITGSTGTAPLFQKFQNLGCKDLYFPKVSDIHNRYVFGGIGKKTTGIHFAAEHKDALTATAGYQYKWTAPDTCTIYFDL